MQIGRDGQFDALKKIGYEQNCKMPPCTNLDWGTSFEASNKNIAIT